MCSWGVQSQTYGINGLVDFHQDVFARDERASARCWEADEELRLGGGEERG